MRRATVNRMRADPADEDAPPPGTAIVRPLRHIRAVRERQALCSANPGDTDASRAARAWAWALGECPTAPVTDRSTAVPPSRSDIEAEITEADDRRFRGDRENRADGAATILRWLIGDDDHVPVRGENRGELVGGFGDVVRSPGQIEDILALAGERQQRAAATGRDLDADPAHRRFAQQDIHYLDGVAATLAWVLNDRPDAPITHSRPAELTTRDLKIERLHAEDVIEQATKPWMADRVPAGPYGEAVKLSISWLLGDSIVPPVDPVGCGPLRQEGDLARKVRRVKP